MFAYFNVSEPSILIIRLILKIVQKLVCYCKWSSIKYKGNVEVVKVNDSETGNIAFRSRFPNPDKLLKNGETGKVLIDCSFKNALVIPHYL
jgi:membrane fusion protein (multidrug efflux system)